MAAATLTDKQKEELNLSVLDYLHTNGFTAAFEGLQRETGLTYLGDGQQRYSNLLEKKWISVVRLQKKVMDLEDKLSVYNTGPSSPGRKAPSNPDFLPSVATPPTTLAGHRAAVTSIAFHPLYNSIATASEDANVSIWDFETGEYERTLKGHTKAVNAVAFDDGEGRLGNLLATASSDLSIKLWDLQNDWKCIRTLQGHDEVVSAVAFTPSGDFLVSASRDKTVKVWEVATGYCVRTIYGHEEWVRGVDVSEDGKFVASCGNDHNIVISDINSGDVVNTLKGHSHVVECVAFAPLLTSKTIEKIVGASEVAVPGQYVASGSRDNTVRVWDTETGFEVMTLTGHDNWIRSIAFHPNGKYLLSTGDDKSLIVWDLTNNGKIVRTVDAVHEQFVTCLDVHKRRGLIATGSEDQTAKVFKCS
ncbi:dynein regulator [Rhizoclosmatium globosum]|uniref:Nuclear distribution protein PAC1 n=1 Tax=Rhizoclosmatium globosum TaxID=329046 RepID=A0A1Y2B8F7_9FUNG|nr:dynein regulator [Rhizoclosmatium globosum]|eukprot:ORY31121.1 dynein regulator [Rhizoclosmatium globosum]